MHPHLRIPVVTHTVDNEDSIYYYSNDFLLKIDYKHELPPGIFDYSFSRRYINNSVSYYHGDILMRICYFMPQDTQEKIKTYSDLVECDCFSNCIVCLEECSENDSYKLSCACKYSCHKKCLEGWLKVNNLCPFCKI